MKFYFCQSCGRRLTEKDIDAGQAKNKKLKGVFCVECSVGVTTMESLPMSNKDARKLLDQAEPSAPPAEERRSSPDAHMPRSRASRSTRSAKALRRGESDRSDQLGGPRSEGANWPVLAGVAFALVVGAGLFLGLGKETPITKKKEAASKDAGAADGSREVVSKYGAEARPSNTSIEVPGSETPAGGIGPVDHTSKTAVPDTEATRKVEVTPGAGEPKDKVKEPEASLKPDVGSRVEKPDSKETKENPDKAGANGERVAKAAEPPSKAEPNTDTKVPAKPDPEPVRLDKVMQWVAEGEPPRTLKERLDALPNDRVAKEAQGAVARLRELAKQADAVETSLKAYLQGQVGKRALISVVGKGKRFFHIEAVNDEGVTVKGYKGPQQLEWSKFSYMSLKNFLGTKLGGGKKADVPIVAWLLLRGDAAHAIDCLKRLPEKERLGLQPFVKVFGEVAKEAEAAKALARFLDLQKQEKWKEAIAAGKELRDRYGATKVVKELKPPLDTQMGDLAGHATGLKGLFWGPAERLPNGMVKFELTYGGGPFRMDMAGDGLAAWFTEFQAKFEYNVGGRYYILPGASVLHYAYFGGSTFKHAGKTYPAQGAGDLRTLQTYRVSAGREGLSFQLNKHKPLIMPGPWQGGRLKWYPNDFAKATIIGRLHPAWLEEMQEVARQRRLFERGEWIDLRPKRRRMPLPEVENHLCHRLGLRIDVAHALAEWHQVGPSWTVDGEEYVSPRDQKGIDVAMCRIWPAALGSGNAELYFEAKIESGDFGVFSQYIRAGSTRSRWLVIGSEQISVRDFKVDFNYVGKSKRFADVKSKVAAIRVSKRPPCIGAWKRYVLSRRGKAMKLTAEGVEPITWQVLDKCYLKLSILLGSKIRLRKVRLRKLP